MSLVRVAMISDDRLFSEGLLRIIGAEPSFVVVGREEAADILLLDSRVGGALRLCAALRSNGRPSVIFVAAPADETWAPVALSAGAHGLLPKSARAEDLINAIRVVHEGSMWAPRRVMAACIRHLAGGAAPKPAVEAILERRLSRREREIFRYAATGLGNKELAERLAISEATVKAHLTRIFQKLGLRGRAELAAAYHGLLPPAA